MPSSSWTRNPTLRPAVFIIAASVVLLLFYQASSSPSSSSRWSSSSGGRKTSGPATDDPISKLSVSIKQTGTEPATLTVKVTNGNASPVTILTWDSPLDPAALSLGLVKITPAGAFAPLELPTIAFRRITPPGPDSLVTIAPEESAEAEIELKSRIVSGEQLFGEDGTGSPSIVLKGSWTSVWAAKQEDISRESLEKMGLANDSFTGDFVSNEIKVTKG